MKNSIKIKKNLFDILYQAGILSKLLNMKKKKGALILTYHRVIDKKKVPLVYSQAGMIVTKKTFKMHLIFLKKKFKLITLDHLIYRLIERKSVSNCCCITFDDGWIDNYTNAFPLLTYYKIPATIFIVTGFIGTKRLFWPEEVYNYLVKGKSNGGMISSNREDKIIEMLKLINRKKRNEIINNIRKKGEDREYRILINWNEVKLMSNSGLIYFGSHTENHEILDQLSKIQIEQEVFNSIKKIKNNLGYFPKFIAFPNGNYNNSIIDILKKYGICGAFTTEKRWCKLSESLFMIPRISIHEDVSSTVPLFLSRILFEFL